MDELSTHHEDMITLKDMVVISKWEKHTHVDTDRYNMGFSIYMTCYKWIYNDKK